MKIYLHNLLSLKIHNQKIQKIHGSFKPLSLNSKLNFQSFISTFHALFNFQSHKFSPISHVPLA